MPRAIISPRRACAARVTVLGVCVCVYVSVCMCVYDYSRTTDYEAIPTASVLQGQEKQYGDFAETTAFGRYGVKTSEKAYMHTEHWLTSTRFSQFGAPWTN